MSQKSTICNIPLVDASEQVIGPEFNTDPFSDILVYQHFGSLTGGATVETKLQTSGDGGANWIDVGTIGVKNTAGGSIKAMPTPVPRNCRIVVVIGGTSPKVNGNIWVEATRTG